MGKRIAWQAIGRPKGEFALPKRRNLFGRGSVSIIWRAVVCLVREAQWERRSGEAEETLQTIGNPYGTQREPIGNNTLLARYFPPSNRLSAGW